ncbi:MAG: fimbrillin family protein [Bacteroidales bacterium]|nr:fimbrillin family protein [Bacteroidales bacterium]
MKTLKILMAATIVFSAVSCQKEIFATLGSDVIKANVNTEANVKTKASLSPSEELVASETAGDFRIDLIASESIENAPLTKGSLYTTANFGSAKVDAYLGKSVENFPQKYIDGGVLNPDGSILSTGGEPYYWLNDIPFHFWCYKPENLSLAAGASGNASFSYQTPASPDDQKDIVIAYSTSTYKDGEGGDFDVHMYHALAAVRFDIRLLPAGSEVVNVRIIDVATSGTCSVSGNSKAGFNWNLSGSPLGTFSQNLEKGYFVTKDMLQADEEKMFFFIPQTLGSSAKIEMTFVTTDSNGTKHQDTMAVSAAGHRWKPGYTYTYRVSMIPKAHEVVVDGEGGYDFVGKKGQNVVYEKLDLNPSTVLKLEWDFEVGNSKDLIIISVRQTLRDGDKTFTPLNHILYNQPANGEGVNYTNNSTTYPKITTTNFVQSGSKASGHTTMIFDLTGIGTGPYDIYFEYNGGNNGNAHWKISNLKLSILE